MTQAARGLRLLGIGTLVATLACEPLDWRALPVATGSVAAGDGATLFWRAVGNGPDTVLVLHGGVGLHHAYLLDALAPLTPGRTLIFYDMRGRGRSSEIRDSSLLTFDRDVDDVDAVRAHFALSHLTLVGHHWGGAVAAVYAARHPGVVDRMLLISPFPEHQSLMYELSLTPGDSAHYSQVLAHAGDRTNPETMAAQCSGSWSLFFGPWRTDTLTPYEQLAPAMCDAPADRLAQADRIRAAEQASLGAWSWQDELSRAHVPALVLEGEGDAVVTDAAMTWVDRLPDARLVMLPAPYLLPWIGSPRRFIRAADRFLGGAYPAEAIRSTTAEP